MAAYAACPQQSGVGISTSSTAPPSPHVRAAGWAGLWWGSPALWHSKERQDAVLVWREVVKHDVLPDQQFVLLPDGPFSLVGRERFAAWVVKEHNAGRLPGYISTGAGFAGQIAPSLLALRPNLKALMGERPRTRLEHIRERYVQAIDTSIIRFSSRRVACNGRGLGPPCGSAGGKGV